MSTINREYEDLLTHVMKNGVDRGDRTGTGTRSVFGYQMRFNLKEGFPLITTKKVFTRGMIAELLWFISGDTNEHTLRNQGVNIWREWAGENGDLGKIYGYQWRSWPTANGENIDQLSQVINDIKNNPESRRHIVSAWNVGELSNMALPPCHAFFQFYVADGKLSCQLYQRSVDSFLGLPFNIASYALLTHLVAKECGLEVGDFVWTGGDVHIYHNHFDQVRTQLEREVYPFPELVIHNPERSIFEHELSDFEIVNYKHHPAIKAPIAV